MKKKKTKNMYVCTVYHHFHLRNTLFKIRICGSGIDCSTTTMTVSDGCSIDGSIAITKSISVIM